MFIFLVIEQITKSGEKVIVYLWYFARFGTIGTLKKHEKPPWMSVSFSKVADSILQLY